MSEFAVQALWQPLLVALAAGGLRLARRLDPASRANFWRLALLLAAAAPAVTGLLPAPAASGPVPGLTIPVDAAGAGVARVWPIWNAALAVMALGRAVWLIAGMRRIRRLGAGRRILITNRVAAPATFGIFRPVIVLPRGLSKLNVRRAVMAHEREHIRRHDYAWNLAVEWATFAVWWHPAIWWMKRQWAADREFACDAAAAARVRDYPALLLEAARTLSSPASRLALGLFESNHFEERLMRLNRPISFLRGWSARAASVSLAAMLVAAGAFLALRPVVRAQHDPPVYRAGGEVTAPRLLYKVEPQYTEAARAERLEGRVVLAAVIGPEGKITEAAVLESLGGGLDEQALAAVYQWRFQPGYRDGQPVAVRATIEVNFRLL